MTQDYFKFLMEILQATLDSQSNEQVLYQLLQANLDKLDENFQQIWHSWITERLAIRSEQSAVSNLKFLYEFTTLMANFPVIKKGINLEIAIVGYEAFSKVFPRQTDPEMWGRTLVNLGIVYSQRICGNEAENLEKAIECFQYALEVYTRDDYPKYWAWTQSYLAITYDKRLRGNKVENLEKAIKLYQAVLEVYTRDNYPSKWAHTQSNLAKSYTQRILGNKAENLDKAIELFQIALQVITPKDDPTNWATTQMNLADAYFERIQGEKAENLEKAIECFQSALTVRTRDDDPTNWAWTQHSLAKAYTERIRGNKEDNLEKGIELYQAALEVYTRDDYPKYWAWTQSNLANTYRERTRGKKEDNLEKAIERFHAALEVLNLRDDPINWAMTHNNLSIVYYRRSKGGRAENLERAIESSQAALQVYTREAFPERWAMAQLNLGNAYNDRIDGEKADNLKKAIELYQDVLQVYTRETFPISWIMIQYNLALAYQKLEQFSNAWQALEATIDTVESLRGEILLGSGIEEDKQKLAEEWNKLYQRMVEVCLELAKDEPQYYTQALEYVERSKARNLVELLETKNLYPKRYLYQNPDDYQLVCRNLDYLRQGIPAKQREIEIVRSRESEEVYRSKLRGLQQQLNNLQQQRDNLLKEINQVDSDFKLSQQVESIPFREIQALIDNRTAIIEWYITNNQILTFIITRHSPHPKVLQSAYEDWEALMNLDFVRYLNRNQKYQWQTNSDRLLSQLAQILNIDQILAQIPQAYNQLILIPHRWLHLFPLHALPLPDQQDKYLLDKFEAGVRYVPSCQLLQLNQKQQKSDLSSLFAIQDPSSNLKYANLEVETIKSFFRSTDVLVKKEATEAVVKSNKNLKLAHCIHFACHGEFNLISPLESALLLAEDESLEDTRLTLAEIFGLSLNQCRLVTLSACETGLTDPSSLSDEYISLPSGFLYAGSSSVVSSLWTVNDLSTAILMIKFYQNLHQGNSVAIALNQAQLWLRDLTKAELKKWIEENQLSLKPEVISHRKLIPILNSDQSFPLDSNHPFRDPFYWAAFCAIGN